MNVSVPTEWKDLTWSQYLKIGDILESKLDDLDKKIALLGVALKMEEEDVLKIDGKNLRLCLNKLEFINDKSTIPHKVPQEIKVGGKRYKVNLNISGYTAGQYVDAKSFMKGDLKTAHQGLAVCLNRVRGFMFIDKVYPYEPEKHAERADGLLNARVTELYPIFVFFCQLWGTLKDPTLAYLKKEARKMLAKLKAQNQREERSKNTGDG